MSNGPWDELFSRFLGGMGERPVYRVDLGRLMSAEAKEMVTDAARHAAAPASTAAAGLTASRPPGAR